MRSTRSLILTIGRAARNVRGKAILYGDVVTDSMKGAIEETERRRSKQMQYNKAHGITPRSVVKEVRDIIDGVYKPGSEKTTNSRALSDVDPDDPQAVSRAIRETEKKMLACARDLDFEQAAILRDRLELLRRKVFGADQGS